jgi:TfoX/Sxy family transcriptional regulator of competence genes
MHNCPKNDRFHERIIESQGRPFRSARGLNMKEKPTWEKSSEQLIALFEDLVPKEPDVAQKKMFGWPCCFANGNLFWGLHKQSMIFRVADADRAAFLKLDGAADFEPMPGRKMKGYVMLADPLHRDRATLQNWAGRSLALARTLPAKAKKKATAKKKASG